MKAINLEKDSILNLQQITLSQLHQTTILVQKYRSSSHQGNKYSHVSSQQQLQQQQRLIQINMFDKYQKHSCNLE